MPAKKAPKKPAKAAKKAKDAKPAPAPAKRPAAPKPTYTPPPKRTEAPTPKPAAKPAPPPAPPAPAARPAPAAAQPPPFVRSAPFADRKAALEALAQKEGLPAVAPPAVPPARPPPTFVKETSPADRKAALEKVVQEQGVTGLLAKAPWKRPGAPAPAPAPVAPPQPATPADRTGPRVMMTKSPIEQTTGRNPPSTVILDSNALMMQFQFHIDIEKEVNRLLGGNYKMVVPTIVVDELQRLAKEGAAKEAAEARMAAELARTFDVVEAPGDGDVGILRLAEKLNAIVVTNDKRLRASLRAKAIPNIYMRSRAFLTIEGHIPGM